MEMEIQGESRALSTIQSCFQCRSFVDELHTELPLEIRNMIWTYLLESEPDAVKRIDQALTETALHAKDCENTSDGPWLVQACFMGPYARTEILELRYRVLFSTFICKNRGISVLHGLATADAYHTGLNPIHFVRRLELHWRIVFNSNEALRDPEYWPHSNIDRPSWKTCFDALRRIKDKSHFSMELRIREVGSRRSIKHFGHLLETFRPVYDEMIQAGAEIKITSLRQWLVDKDMELDVTNFYGMDKEDWYKQLLSHSVDWDLKAAKRWNVKAPEGSLREWHVEGDKEFDDMVERGLIKY